ncbi:hypothetical protein [Streptomyces sp. NBC_00063]|uniref:hypothetical protein n=1 Tax=Streptomyces sp. NBC_00063 TaxID=2975638 RepID=UPI003D729B65
MSAIDRSNNYDGGDFVASVGIAAAASADGQEALCPAASGAAGQGHGVGQCVCTEGATRCGSPPARGLPQPDRSVPPPPPRRPVDHTDTQTPLLTESGPQAVAEPGPDTVPVAFNTALATAPAQTAMPLHAMSGPESDDNTIVAKAIGEQQPKRATPAPDAQPPTRLR